MNHYKEYMDDITVSSTLHEKLIDANNSVPFFQKPIFLTALLSILLLAIVTFSLFNKETNLPITSNSKDKLNLVLKDANPLNTSSRIFIPGHTWRDLTEEELTLIIPLLEVEQIQSAVANFSSENEVTTLFNIFLSYEIEPNIQVSTQISPSMVLLDYKLTGNKLTNTFLGHSIDAGIYQDTFSQTSILFSTFKLDDISYYVEIYGETDNEENLINALNKVTSEIILGGTAPIEIVKP